MVNVQPEDTVHGGKASTDESGAEGVASHSHDPVTSDEAVSHDSRALIKNMTNLRAVTMLAALRAIYRIQVRVHVDALSGWWCLRWWCS